MKTEIVKLSQIQTNAANPRHITDDKFTKLVNSILVFPKMLELRPIVVDETLVSLGGNMRYRALTFIADTPIADLKARLCDIRDFQKKTEAEKDALIAYWERWQDKPTATIIKASELSEDEQRQFIIKDNVGYGEWDYEMLANEWEAEDLEDWGLDVWQDKDGEDSSGGESSKPENGSLVDRFVIPPFSILDTRRGYWQARKKTWRELIGDMGESRNDTLITSPEIKYKDIYQKTREHRESLGLSFKEYLDKYVSDEVKEREGQKVLSAGVSLLDPVMAELVCRWFGLENCKTFDCFAGDSVFGYVSAHLGNEFTGIEIREEQAQLNNERVEGMSAHYINDDGQNVAQHIAPDSQDLLFSCPPYYDLEVYSDLEKDASNQETYEDFLAILSNAFKAALGCLKEDRFAVIVVGDVRDKKTGFYHNFVDDMKRIFKENGAALYNELILIETGASTALRAARYMETRKVAKMHQNILVFYKGNPKNIKHTFKKIEYASEDLELFRVDCGDEPAED
jgi:DNA modification methylase